MWNGGKRTVKTLAPLVKAIDTRTVAVKPKQVDAHYLSPEHKAWRKAVIDRAGARCEAIGEDGKRCRKAAPGHRMFADHIVEKRDGGDLLDPANGQCLCGSHHSFKTARARAQRMAATPST